ncbi:MAG: sensor histidine kinase [Lachnospiraceae bacterium]|nr:sensor histidine kinase [Lachnospiraceae bacterium]
MTSFLDKILIYCFGAIAIFMSNLNEKIVPYLLAGILLVGIFQILEDYESLVMELVLIGIFIGVLIIFNKLVIYVPIAVYHHIYMYNKKKNKYFLYGLDILILLYCGKNINSELRYILFFSIVFTICMAIKSRKIESDSDAIKKLRDDSVERAQALSDENRFLIKNMDKEIHIATLSERNRIARDIHDNVGHLISRSILQLGAIRAVNKEKTVGMLLEQLKDTLDDAMNNIRESVHDLHKESFDLKNAADSILKELSGYEVNFECDISMEADKEIKYAFLTILKEAVTNIIKHSNANKVDVVMRELDNYYQMLIEDNGNVKKDIRNVNAGIGVSNMEERVRKMSGIINISTDNGFRIYILIPKEIT